MYEIIVAINGKEFVAETRADLISASEVVSWYRAQRVQARYRAVTPQSAAAKLRDSCGPATGPGYPRAA